MLTEAPVAEGTEVEEPDYTDGHMGLLGDIPIIRRTRSPRNSTEGHGSEADEKPASINLVRFIFN